MARFRSFRTPGRNHPLNIRRVAKEMAEAIKPSHPLTAAVRARGGSFSEIMEALALDQAATEQKRQDARKVV